MYLLVRLSNIWLTIFCQQTPVNATRELEILQNEVMHLVKISPPRRNWKHLFLNLATLATNITMKRYHILRQLFRNTYTT
jgi:hypothetical protein